MTQEKQLTIQQVLGAFLSAHGEHEAAAEAFASTDRLTWLRLTDLAIRTAPDYNRTHCCRAITLAMDSPEAGGPSAAEDFEIVKEPHPFKAGEFLYRGFILREGNRVDAGFISPRIPELYARLVGSYVVRNITLPEGETL